ncbi:MAG: flagellar motor protein MotD [Burkholderiales bacterium]|nr:flagellar motor protein MotD [Burkholderiales bacterium]
MSSETDESVAPESVRQNAAGRRPRRRPRRYREGGESPDRWLVSYADFITLLFAFFVVMYAISQVNEGKYKLLSDALIQAFKPVASLQGTSTAERLMPGEGVRSSAEEGKARLDKIAQELVTALGDLIKTGQVRVTESGLGLAIEINASVLFESAQADLMPQAMPVLGSLANALAPLPNDIQVEGHTDSTPITSARFPSNWELSASRAGSVVRLFNALGVASVRLVAVGYADTRNIAPNDTPEGRARNRRVTVMILPERERNAASAPAVPPRPAWDLMMPAAPGESSEPLSPLPQAPAAGSSAQ